MASAAFSDRKDAMKEAFLTEEGVQNWRRHRVYDLFGVLAALALLFLWADQSGFFDAFLDWTDSLPRADS